MGKVVLAAVDGSTRAAGVYAAAREWADMFGATVHLFRAVALPPEIPAAASNQADGTTAIVQRNTMIELQRLASDAGNVKIEPAIISAAAPWRLILDAAARLDAVLIVIGSHGFGGWDHLLGTTASQVCNRADRNVLVVHHRSESRTDPTKVLDERPA